jgi:hypothetical protein
MRKTIRKKRTKGTKINKKKRTLGRKHIKNSKKMRGGYEMNQDNSSQYTDAQGNGWILELNDDEYKKIYNMRYVENKNTDEIINELFKNTELLKEINTLTDLKTYVTEIIEAYINTHSP